MTFKLNIQTAEQIAAQAVADKRNGATLTRMQFCLALAMSGIISKPEAIKAAKGDWPASMNSFLSFLDADQSVDVQIEWAAATSIDRMHPFVLTLGSWLGLSETQMDGLFGIQF